MGNQRTQRDARREAFPHGARREGRNRCLYLILWILYLSRGIT